MEQDFSVILFSRTGKIEKKSEGNIKTKPSESKEEIVSKNSKDKNKKTLIYVKTF